MSRNTRRAITRVDPNDLDANFVRKVKNFINNFSVDGGTFRFDGYRPMLRIPPVPEIEPTPPLPLVVLQGPTANGIIVNDGTVNSRYTSGFASLRPAIGGTPIDDPTPPELILPNGTSRVYIKADMTAGPSGATVKYQYETTDPMTIISDPGFPSDTGDSYADEAGTAYFYLARVVVAAGVITDIDSWDGGNLTHRWSNLGNLWQTI